MASKIRIAGSWSERGYSLSQPIPNILGRKGVIPFLNQYLTTGISYITTTHMNAWLRKYESIGFGWKRAVASHNQPPTRGKGVIPFLNLTNILYHVYGDMSTPYTIFFLFNQQLILLPSYLRHK